MSWATASVLFFFNARGTGLERSAIGLYRSLIIQLVSEERSLPAMKAFFTTFCKKEEALGEGKSTWQLMELQDAIADALISGQLPPLELFIDDLDECDEDQVRRFVRFISVPAAKALAKELVFSVCWSSRHYPHISIKNSFELHVEEQNNSDIQRFVHDELATCGTVNEGRQFEREIVERSRGIFLWAKLVVQKLIKAADLGISPTSMLDLLKNLPMELNGLLESILQSIDPAFRSDALHLIQWVLFAKRPLFLEELELALQFSAEGLGPSSLAHFALSTLDSVELDSVFSPAVRMKALGNVGSDSNRLRRYVTTTSGGLIGVTVSKGGRKYLEVTHETARDFLLQPNIHTHLGMAAGPDFCAMSSKTLLEACQKFILCPEFRYCLPLLSDRS